MNQNLKAMKLFTYLTLFLLVASSSYATRLTPRGPISLPSNIQRFIKDKKAEARQMALDLKLNLPDEFWRAFDMALSGDIGRFLNAYSKLQKNYQWYQRDEPGPTVSVPAWQELAEVEMIVDAYIDKDWQSSETFAKSVIKSIPPGSIYFGGTDAGRGLITALSKSHTPADPFFTLTQNQLVDLHYLDYVRWLYGKQIHIPDKYDVDAARETYLADAFRRLQHDLAKPWEPKQVKAQERLSLKDGKPELGSVVATMEVNARLAERIFKANADREFFIEVSLPMDWMYPYLSPHNFILKLNRERLKFIPDSVIQADRKLWANQQRRTMGWTLNPGTSFSNFCAHFNKAFDTYKEVPGPNLPLYGRRLYSKTRRIIGDVYFWRIDHANSPEERKQMTGEAELAFQQALCFCPLNAEVMASYILFLLSQERHKDAESLARIYHNMQPENPETAELLNHLTPSSGAH